jgi:hypothetical protein
MWDIHLYPLLFPLQINLYAARHVIIFIYFICVLFTSSAPIAINVMLNGVLDKHRHWHNFSLSISRDCEDVCSKLIRKNIPRSDMGRCMWEYLDLECCVHMTQILFVSRSSFKYWSNKTVYTSSQRKFCNKNIKNQIIPKTFLQRFLKVGRIHTDTIFLYQFQGTVRMCAQN